MANLSLLDVCHWHNVIDGPLQSLACKQALISVAAPSDGKVSRASQAPKKPSSRKSLFTESSEVSFIRSFHRKFPKSLENKSPISIPGRHVCFWSSTTLVCVIMAGPVIFHQSECCVRGRTRCIRKTMPIRAGSHFFAPSPFPARFARQLVSHGFAARTVSPMRTCSQAMQGYADLSFRYSRNLQF